MDSSPRRDHAHGGLIGGRAVTRPALRPEWVLTLRQAAALALVLHRPRRGDR